MYEGNHQEKDRTRWMGKWVEGRDKWEWERMDEEELCSSLSMNFQQLGL